MKLFNKKVAVALIVASGSSSIMTSYVEDEVGHTETSNISVGFGWISSAHATLDCTERSRGNTDCTSRQDPCDIIDCNPPPVVNPCDFYDCYAFPPENPGDGGGGGGVGSEPLPQNPPSPPPVQNPPSPPELDPEKARCYAQTVNLVNQCKSVYTKFDWSVVAYCGLVSVRFPGQAGKAYICGTTAAGLALMIDDYCETSGENRNLQQCNAPSRPRRGEEP